jgi:TetR/AcrR family transcriptional regulator, cholesterol catabolism regulator
MKSFHGVNIDVLRPSLEERRQYIAEVATKVFARKGYKAASLRDIATEAGISKAGLYHYFKNKEDVLYYLLKTKHYEHLKALKDCVKNCEEKKLKPEEAFRELIQTYANYINNQKELRLVVLQDRHQLTGANKRGLRKLEQAILRTLRDQVEKLPGISRKYDPNVISFLIIAMSHWLGSWLREDGKLSQDEAITQSAEIILHGAFQKIHSGQPTLPD